MTPVEILALIVVVSVVAKVVVLLIKPKSWMKLPKAMDKQPMVVMVVSLLLAALVLYILLFELTIIQVIASGLFVILLIASSFAAFSKEVTEMANKLIKDKNLIKRIWLPLAVWTILVIWVLYALLV